MNRIYKWYNSLSKQIRDSIIISVTILGMISTILSILGISLGDCKGSSLLLRTGIVIVAFLIICAITYITLGRIFNNSVKLTIRQTSVSVDCGNIFEAQGLRVIGCDTHFNTIVDDIVISKKSLHGQLVLEHGSKDEIDKTVEAEARRLGLNKNSDDLYDFPLGTIIPYNSSIDNHTYLMLAMTELNSRYESHTNMAKYERMLMKMWKEIDRVYASQDIALPLLGAGIARFDDGPKHKDDLLRCMLCTLNSSGVSLNSGVKIIIYGDIGDIPLYEYKDIFHTIPRR
ncbi:MAG: macro domain-containing protein [Porcipelethomonas sp.]